MADKIDYYEVLGGLYTDGGHEYVADYFLYALYHTEQTSDDGDKHAE